MADEARDWDIVSSVGLTALAVTAARAVETSREDGLVEDPYAAAFVRATRPPIPMPTSTADLPNELWDRMALFMGLRSRFFDEYFAEAWTAGVRQTVLLAAGLDSRAYRLEWPEDSTVFEVDQPRVLEFKDEALAEQGAKPACDRRVVAVDLRDDWEKALLAKGFDPEQPTAWLAEGLLPYLPDDAVERLLDTVHRLSTPDSTVAVEYMLAEAVIENDPEIDRMMEEFGFDVRPLLAGGYERAGEFLTHLGWAVGEVSGNDLAERYGREMNDSLSQRFGTNSRYLTGRLG
ncbi:SAM-dependent methyltransferase [Amycolatopsis acidicola]|uniref:S-adenosyl-L-methionine-dependent methyltransferase n=1 Tax=Amycolatopsis acidicola TaxID=2596893 RepID=A0A5N0URT2_9PSEU|nr:SAM-dependent methyltransferase [Amycolatopsis acidicola]KAA9154051.1 SAM-dependent methyltransferase [Amycolatopsis acidicola]